MPRAATTTDVFNAIAEARRREIIDVLARSGPLPVGQIVSILQLPQPLVSKHLAVLREVGIVSAAPRGRARVYAVNADRLKIVHDWVRTFERFWTSQLDRIKNRAERAARASTRAGASPSHPSPPAAPLTPPENHP